MKTLRLFLLGCFFLLFAVPANAVMYGFENITNNDAGDAAIGENQLFVDVTSYGTNQVLFTFGNNGSGACSITDVYFDDGNDPVLGNTDGSFTIINDPGYVEFSQGANPGDLPGGNSITPNFNVTSSLLADSENPSVIMGVNPGETLGIVFDLVGSKSFDDVITALNADPNTGSSLRIGIHVQGFSSGGSESFINKVPEPSAALFLGCLLFGVGLLGRKRLIS